MSKLLCIAVTSLVVVFSAVQAFAGAGGIAPLPVRVPEPGTLAIFTLGAAAIVALKGWRR